MRNYVCYCGATECPRAQCRFYSDRAEMEAQQQEFWAQWQQMERREAEEQHGE